MKKTWLKPEIDTLDISLTMANPNGTHYDGNFSEHELVVPDAYSPS